MTGICPIAEYLAARFPGVSSQVWSYLVTVGDVSVSTPGHVLWLIMVIDAWGDEQPGYDNQRSDLYGEAPVPASVLLAFIAEWKAKQTA